MRSALSLVDELLRDRALFLRRIEEEADPARLARALLAAIAVGAAVFGATLGSYRGGIQILFAAIKLPAVVLFTAAICTPGLNALARVLCGAASFRRELTLLLGALALGCLLLAALSPVVFLAGRLDASYHQVTMIAVACCGIAGIPALLLLLRGLPRGVGHKRTAVFGVLLALLALVGTQMSWTLRPFLLRPRTVGVPFVRSIEGSFLESVRESLESARGVYRRNEAPLPERP
jgi:hypothetical protein